MKVDIDDEKMKRISERVKSSEFKDEKEYINFVLDELLYQLESQDEEISSEDISEDEEKVKQRLRDLGYTD